MRISRFRKFNQAVYTCCFFFTLGATAVAQVQPQPNDTINVTSNPATFIQAPAGGGAAITVNSGVTGVTVNNDAGGMITSVDSAGIVNAGSLTVDNSGSISGTMDGIVFINDEGTGSITNRASGSITSDSRAVDVGLATLIDNQGAITGTGNQRNGTVYADSTADNFTINNSGSIDAGAGFQGAGFSAELSGTGNNFSINNSGTIDGRGTAGAGLTTAGDGIRLERIRVGGALDGSTTGLFTGTIDNSGDIRSEGNSGTTAGFRAVNGVSFQGTLDNSGTISGTQNGVYFGNPTPAGGGDHTGGVVNNSGTISSDSRALNIDGEGLEVNNSGDILGTGNQRNGTVYADATANNFTLNNTSTGTIDAGAGLSGAGFSAELSAAGNNFTIDNSGTIQGRGTDGAGLTTAGDGIRLERTRVGGALDATTTGLFTGTINNSGDVSSEGNSGTTAGFRAVNGVSFQGTLDNSGTISGTQNGVYFGNPTPAGGGDHTGGVVNNSGTISSDSRAFNLDGEGLAVNNTGDILATGAQRNGTFYVDGTADNFSLNNSGTIDARGGSGSAVSVQVGSFDGDVQTGSIVNTGSFIGQGSTGNDAGLRLFSNTLNATFQGDILNDVGGLVTSDSSSALLIEGNVNFDGTFFNNGEIAGSIELSSGDLQLSDTSVLSLDVDSLADFESVNVGGDIFFDGTLDLNFADPSSFTVGQTIDVFDFSLAQGSFDSILADGLVFDTTNLLSQGTLTISSVAAVPEPSAAIVLVLGSLGFLQRRRRQA